MSLTGIKEGSQTIADAIQQIFGKDVPDETRLAAAQLQAVIDHLIDRLDALATKHEGIAAQFLDGFTITISFERKKL